LGETDGVLGLVLSFSRNPRNSKALLPESTVVTAIEKKGSFLSDNTANKRQTKFNFARCWPKRKHLGRKRF